MGKATIKLYNRNPSYIPTFRLERLRTLLNYDGKCITLKQLAKAQEEIEGIIRFSNEDLNWLAQI